MRSWARLSAALGALAVVCFVVMALTYDSQPVVEAGYFNEADGSTSGDVIVVDERGVDHRPWMGAGIAFLVSAAAVAVTSLPVRLRRERNGSRQAERARSGPETRERR